MPHVYILANEQRMLYIGVTLNLRRRLMEHRERMRPRSYTAKHRIDRLVHAEEFSNLREARARERQLKGWRRSTKVELIRAANPRWLDLAESVGVAAG